MAQSSPHKFKGTALGITPLSTHLPLQTQTVLLHPSIQNKHIVAPKIGVHCKMIFFTVKVALHWLIILANVRGYRTRFDRATHLQIRFNFVYELLPLLIVVPTREEWEFPVLQCKENPKKEFLCSAKRRESYNVRPALQRRESSTSRGEEHQGRSLGYEYSPPGKEDSLFHK